MVTSHEVKIGAYRGLPTNGRWCSGTTCHFAFSCWRLEEVRAGFNVVQSPYFLSIELGFPRVTACLG